MPPEPSIVIADYGAGNLRSVRRALEAVGQHPEVTSDPTVVDRADGLVLPGVGSANDAMKALNRLGLVKSLRDYAASGRPFLGVCVGLQVFFEWSDEGGGTECLGLIPGRVRRFEMPAGSGLKVPHMGWNQVHLVRPHPLLVGVPDESHFYFVHSYYAEPTDSSTTVGLTDYGATFSSVVSRDNVVAVQFHPEKSADLGVRLYRNFAASVAGRTPVASR